MLSIAEKKLFLDNVTIPHFLPNVDQKIYTVVFDYNYEIVICGNCSAQSIGFDTWQEAVGLSFSDYNNVELAAKIFNLQYNDSSSAHIHEYAKKIFEVQKRVFVDKMVVSFLDLLPYDGKLLSYLVTYVPVFHPSGEVVAIQSFAARSRLFSHQEYLSRLCDVGNGNPSGELQEYKLTIREHEIMFLLANGSSQEQISQILKVSRSTIANIIANQLCIKFGIFGSNTKLLTQKAFACNFHQVVPPSLYRPYIIILDEGNNYEDSFL